MSYPNTAPVPAEPPALSAPAHLDWLETGHPTTPTPLSEPAKEQQ